MSHLGSPYCVIPCIQSSRTEKNPSLGTEVAICEEWLPVQVWGLPAKGNKGTSGAGVEIFRILIGVFTCVYLFIKTQVV